MRKKRCGFTLFELMLVAAVLLVAAAAVTPSLSSLWGNTPINAAADTIRARMADARACAMAEGRPYRFDVLENTGKMRVAPDSSEFWGDGSTMASTANGSGPAPFIAEDNLPRDIRFCSPEGTAPGAQAQDVSAGSWMCPVVFLPDGTTREDAAIAFANGSGTPLVLRVQSATGAITSSR